MMAENKLFRASYAKRFAAARAINYATAQGLRETGKLGHRVERMVEALDTSLASAKHDAATASRLAGVRQGVDLADVPYHRLNWPLRLFAPTWLGEAFDPRFGVLLFSKESLQQVV